MKLFFVTSSTSGKPGSNKGSPESGSADNGRGGDATPEVTSALEPSAISVVVIVVVVVRATVVTPLRFRTTFVSVVNPATKEKCENVEGELKQVKEIEFIILKNNKKFSKDETADLPRVTVTHAPI